MSATLVLTNGRIHTMNPQQPQATAVAIRHNHILAVGDDDAMRALLGPGGEWVDLHGRALTPGLVDAHVHFQHFALGLQLVNLDGATSLDDALTRIQTAHRSPLTAHWLQGRGWRIDDWPTHAFPTAADLDRIVPDRPVCLRDKSGHAAWVNTRALRIAGIDQHTPDPPGGQIQRGAAGQATGILFEDAMELVTRHIPRETPAQIAAAMQAAQQHCWQVGLTGLHDFDGRDCFLALQLLREQGELGLRIVKNVPVYRLEHAIGVGLRSGFGDDWLRIGSVKIFADGALGPRTAAMLAPYENDPSNLGIVVTDKEEMMEKVSAASAAGLSVTIHAIGDRANHDVLDVYEAVREEEKSHITHHASRITHHALRHRIEHVQIIHPADQPRLAQLGIIASMQPTHATSDMEMADAHWGERARHSYAWRTMLDSGALLVFGSDAPIEKIDPLPGIHAAVTRRRADGSPGPAGWFPEQKLTMSETIFAFTTAAALTSGQAGRLGMIAPDKLADLTIYSADPFTTSPDELLDITIDATLVDGQFKHRTF
ncbi:MAG: amidohydrolase [Chloroflexi bacterium]|nr:amidohydrolase [Ardenticatenaceae bacterium]NOG33938.1 amidohydrolase [Chloroflexota bacterium]GIK55622.1 MAG: amidohydrolase [Chloroflexota bacterium]